MSVLINKETGLAEEVPVEQIRALAGSTHKVPIVSPEGKLVSAPGEDVPSLISQGYTHANDEHLNSLLKTAKHGSRAQQALTAAEGAAKSATLGLSTGVETALGVDPEDIAAREATNPKSHLTGSLAGVLLPGPGMEVAGLKVAGKLLGEARGAYGLSQDVMAAKRLTSAGARAINAATQGAIMQTGDEVHKMFLNDPHQTWSTAALNIGLSSLLTGTLGGGVPKGGELLKNAVRESKTVQALGAAKDKIQTMAAENPEIASALSSWMLGHGALPGYVVGGVARAMGLANKISMATKWGRAAIGKMAGVEGEVGAEASKSLSQYVRAVFRGNKAIEGGIKSIFEKGAIEALPDLTDKDLKKLAGRVRAAELDPTKLSAANLASTMPAHATAGSESMMRAVQYLSSIRPKEDKPAPLSPVMPINKVEKERYSRALRIAEQPLGILKEVKAGSLTVEDLATMHGTHPELLDLLRSRMFNAMGEAAASGITIPYKTSLGLSLFLGQPLIASTLPANIIANQGVWQNQAMAQQGPQRPVKPNPKAFKSSSQEAATPGQSRELNKQSRIK